MPHTAANPSRGPYFLNAKGTGVKNNGATLFYGGTIANSTVYSSLGLTYLGYRSGFSANLPYQGGSGPNIGVVSGLSNGTWQTMTKGRYIMLTYTNFIAGISNTLLNSPSSYGQKGGMNLIGPNWRSTKYIMTGGWYYTTGLSVGKADFADTINTEQYPGTKAIPGRLFYIATTTAKDGTPKADSYKAKTD